MREIECIGGFQLSVFSCRWLSELSVVSCQFVLSGSLVVPEVVGGGLGVLFVFVGDEGVPV